MFGKYFEQIKNLHIIFLKYIYFKSEFISDIFPLNFKLWMIKIYKQKKLPKLEKVVAFA